MCAEIESIAAHCGPNAPKLQGKVYLALESDVETIAPAVAGAIPTITMVATKVLAEWEVSIVDPNFTGTPEGDADGLSIPVNVNLFIPKMTALKTATINASLGANVVAIVIDKNGNKWVIGEKGNGAVLVAGAQTGDKNGYPVTLTWDAGRLPWSYGGVLPLAA